MATLTYSNINSFSLNAGSGTNPILVNSTAAGCAYTLDTSAGGEDNLTLGAGRLIDIAGPVIFHGNSRTNAITLRDELSSGAPLYVITGSTVTRTGFTLLTYDQSDLLYLQSAPSGSNVSVNSSAFGTPITVWGGPGNDRVIVGDTPTFSLSHLGAPVSVNGNGGADELYVNDPGDPPINSFSYSISPTAIQRTNSPPINFSGEESIYVNGSAGWSFFNVNGTPSSATYVQLNTGDGKDDVVVNATAAASPVYLYPSAGDDWVAVNTDGGAPANLILQNYHSLESLTVASGGTATSFANGVVGLKTKSLNITGTGTLDLNDNNLILDYTGASQLSAIQTLINTARAGGAWTGPGLTSGSARTATPKNTTLGAMEAADFKGIYGASATFDGLVIDTTAVLVKYTYYGDANFNGRVTFDDYVRTDNGFNNHRTGWINGDFNGNGAVTFDDYVLLDLAFNTQNGVL
jgi:hypothetical protein